MKHIRELRIGPPKSGKTVSIVGTYPKPMLVFLFNKGELDVIPNRIITGRDFITLDITQSDIKYIKSDELIPYCRMKREELPKVICVDFTHSRKMQMTELFVPLADSKAYNDFYNAVNYLVTIGCPWQTFVLENITTLCDTLMSFVAEKQTSWLSDARKWSPAVGGKVMQHIAVMCNLPLHTVYIAHSHIDKDEKTDEVRVLPLAPGRLASQVGSLVSQYFYATAEDGTLKVWTKPKGIVKAIGCRWPAGLPQVVGADFKSIYGNEQL